MANFGPAVADLMPGATNAVDVCLAVKPGEHVALIADEASRSVAASLSAALSERHASQTNLLLEDFGPRSEERRVGKECRSLCDWSSDVCSSDLADCRRGQPLGRGQPQRCAFRAARLANEFAARRLWPKIGRASCRERV